MAPGAHDGQQLTPTEVADLLAALDARSELAERFEEVADLLASVDITTVWDEADERERRVLIEDLVDAVYVYPTTCGSSPAALPRSRSS